MAIVTTLLASLALAAIRPGFPWFSAALGVVVLDFLFGGFGSLAFTAVAAVAFGQSFLLSHRRQIRR